MRLTSLKPSRVTLLSGSIPFAIALIAFLALRVYGATLTGAQIQRPTSDQDYLGTELGGQIAPDFRLMDQRGEELALSDFTAKVVVLAFLDPLCTDSCPLTAMHFGLANQGLGKEADRVAFLAVNVNTDASSVPDMEAATEKWGMSQLQNWHFLTGSGDKLEAVWDAYNIVAEGPPKPGKPGKREHTPGVYVIDQSGRERWYVSIPFEAWSGPPLNEALQTRLREILKEMGG